MQASDMKLGKVLSTSQLFVVPMFQRPYVWSQERNWAPLWDDIRRAAEAVEAEWARTSEELSTTYFLGAIVTQERRRSPQRLSSMNVIDGQQRMTTVQVLIAAARAVATECDCDAVAGRFDSLVTNSLRSVHPDYPDDLLKVLPLPQDREAYLWAVRPAGSDVPRPLEQKQIALAREWFEGQIEEWATADGADAAQRLDALHYAIDERVQIVHIMLDSNEDPQVIFEALNGRGEPLLPADLVKNLLFQTLDAEGEHDQADRLLMRGWLPFDSAPWRDNITTGRISRAFIDVFLAYWLTVKTGREVPIEHLYSAFKRWLGQSGQKASDVIMELHHDGVVFLQLRSLDTSTPLGGLIDSMEATLTSTPWPVLLSLKTRKGVPDNQVQLAAGAIDSFTMRRAICGLTTKDYNRLFIHVLGAAQAAPPDTVGEVIRDTLASQTADSRNWPSDSAFRAGLLESELYPRLTKPRLRSLLVGMENFLRSRLNEDVGSVAARRSDLTIEHLLPQKWEAHWPLPVGSEDTKAARVDSVHRLGNLTLLTHSLNPRVGNSSWATKAAELRRHALLRLTTSSVFAAPPEAVGDFDDHQWAQHWDEERIRRRSLWLADVAVEAWPRPEGGEEIDWAGKLDIRRLVGDRKSSTTVADLVEAGLLRVGDELTWNRPQLGQRHSCVVQGDGTLRLPDGVVKQTPSGAAIALTGGSHDGWTVWRVPSHGDRMLADLRAEFEQSEAGLARVVGQLVLDSDVLAGGRVQFTVAGRSFDLDANDVRQRLQGRSPEMLYEHWAEIDGIKWPPKQVLDVVTGVPRSEFVSVHADSILRRLGFRTSRNA